MIPGAAHDTTQMLPSVQHRITGEEGRRGRELTKGCSHAGGQQARLPFPSWKVRSGEVTALLIVVPDIEAGEFGEANPQSAAGIIDVLPVQGLKGTRKQSEL